MPDLCDANVWLALAAGDHAHHGRSQRYMQEEASREMAFCRVTELALLRLLSNHHVFGDATMDGGSAWRYLQTLLSSPRVTRLDEPKSLDAVLGTLGTDLDIRGKHWTDTYLAAFATAAGARLVSFDADFARYPGLSWLHLEA